MANHKWQPTPSAVVSLTLDEARRLGIVVCAGCGCPENNHFNPESGGPCARCRGCQGYKRGFSVGRPIRAARRRVLGK